MPITIDKDVCLGCGACVGVCPTGAIELGEDGKAGVVNPDVCAECGACVGTCPVSAVTMD